MGLVDSSSSDRFLVFTLNGLVLPGFYLYDQTLRSRIAERQRVIEERQRVIGGKPTMPSITALYKPWRCCSEMPDKKSPGQRHCRNYIP